MKNFATTFAALCLGSLLTVPAAIAQHGWHHSHRASTTTTTPSLQRIYVYEVGAHGPNTSAFSLIDCSATGVSGPDNLGNCYVLADATGHFDISGLYSSHCTSDSSLVVLLATDGEMTGGWDKGGRDKGRSDRDGRDKREWGTGGSSQSTFTNVSLMPVDCAQLPGVSSVEISDITTVAAAFAVAPFANHTALPADGFSTKDASLSALHTAFAAANALVSGLTGLYVVPDATTQQQINTIADVAEACIYSTADSGSGDPCGTLFHYATTATDTPTDSYQAILSMAENPTNNVSSLFGLIESKPKWLPALSTKPSTWALSIPNGPTISSLSKTSGAVGGTLTIIGTNLVEGSTTPVVVVGGVQATVSGTPTSSSITVTVPASAISGFVGVYPGTYASNFVPFTVN